MWKFFFLGLRPRNSQKRHTLKGFSLQCIKKLCLGKGMTSGIRVMRLVIRSLRRMSSSPHQGVSQAKDAGKTKDTY
jgi:hypothetical protein